MSHGAIFLSSTIVSIAIPVVILVTSDDPVVKENAKESLNFHINLYIYAIICGLLTLLVIGIPLLFILVIISVIMPIIAIVNVVNDPDRPYRYPFVFRVLS